MVISFFIGFVWLFMAILIVCAKKSAPQAVSFVFLLVDFINSNVSFLFGDPIHLFGMPDDPARYVSFALLQSIAIPAIITIMVLVSYRARTVSRKVLCHAATLCILIGIEALCKLLNIISYSGLTVLLSLVGYRLVLYCIPFPALQWFERLCRRP